MKKRVGISLDLQETACMTQSDVTRTIVNTVAEQEGVSPEELPSLEENINAEAFSQLTDTHGPPPEPLEFTYVWYQVTVHPSGEVTITS